MKNEKKKLIRIKRISRLKLIKTLVFVSFLINLISCRKQNDLLLGTWGTYTVMYKEEDISGIDFSSNVFTANKMIINSSQNTIFFPLKSGNDYGRYKVFARNGSEFLRIYDSTDPRFDDTYLISITEIYSRNKGKNKGYRLELKSDDWLIVAEKSVADISLNF